MNRDKLNDNLEELKEEIEKLKIKDPQAAERLQKLSDNIKTSLESQSDNTIDKELNTGIHNDLEVFEVEHPAATGILNRIATLLSDMGI